MSDELHEEIEPKPTSRFARFLQRQLRVYQPLLTPKVVISCYTVCGVLFGIIGLAIKLVSDSVDEYTYDYTDVSVSPHTGTSYFDILVESEMVPPIYVYYQLDGFHQNHRRYINSRSQLQMQENLQPIVDAASLASCSPWVQSEIDGRVNFPCGQIARTIFNDTYILQAYSSRPGGQWRIVDVDDSAKSIAWPTDVEGGKFHNLDPEAVSQGGVQNQVNLNMWIMQRFPPLECRQKILSEAKPFVPVYVAMRRKTLDSDGWNKTIEVPDCKGYKIRDPGVGPQCNFVRLGKNFTCEGDYAAVQVDNWGIESGHFMVWMRIAGFSVFRKLWGRIDTPLVAGTTLRVHFADNFPVKEFYGRKAFVITTVSFLGGQNDFLGYGYLFVGCCCLAFGLIFSLRHIIKPRALGDLRLLC